MKKSFWMCTFQGTRCRIYHGVRVASRCRYRRSDDRNGRTEITIGGLIKEREISTRKQDDDRCAFDCRPVLWRDRYLFFTDIQDMQEFCEGRGVVIRWRPAQETEVCLLAMYLRGHFSGASDQHAPTGIWYGSLSSYLELQAGISKEPFRLFKISTIV